MTTDLQEASTQARTPARGLQVTIVAANTFQYDARLQRTATSLAVDGHRVRILGWSSPGLAEQEELAPGVQLIRLPVDRRISTALRPLPHSVRSMASRAIGLDPEASVLPPVAPRGLDRLRHPLRRLLEIVANVRRVGPWTDAVVAAAPDTDVFHGKALIVLPVVRGAAHRLGARFVYDVADYHSEAARLARMFWVVRELVRRRERAWARQASGFTAVSDPVADLVARRWGVPRPALMLNCPPAWHPDEPGLIPSTRIRDALGLAPDRPIVLYQGGLSVDRGIEELVAAASEPALTALDAAIVFIGFGRLEAYLQDESRRLAGLVHLLPAVPWSELVEWTAGADVSFVGQPPRTLNQKLNLPNKLFESLMAGVPVVVAADNEQCRLTTAEGVGICCDVDSSAAIAVAVARLLSAPEPERQRLRMHCRSVALEKYTWERNAEGLLGLYHGLAEEPVATSVPR